MKEMDFSDRKFKFWFYQVSHSEAIIRSPKMDVDKVYDFNIDIYIGDIEYIEVPRTFQGLQIDMATKEDMKYLSRKLGKDISVEKIVVLISGNSRYYIVASVIKVMQNDLEFGVLPICTFLTNKEGLSE